MTEILANDVIWNGETIPAGTGIERVTAIATTDGGYFFATVTVPRADGAFTILAIRESDLIVAPATLSVTEVRHSFARPIFGHGPGTEMTTAVVTTETGVRMSVSKLAGETGWTIDALVAPDSAMPVFANGAGSRVTRRRVLSESQAAAVDAAVTAHAG